MSFLCTVELAYHMSKDVKRCGCKETRNYHLLWFWPCSQYAGGIYKRNGFQLSLVKLGQIN